MGHLQTVEADVRRLIEEADEEKLVRYVKEQVLASYRNGQAVGKLPTSAGAAAAPLSTPPRRVWKKRAA